MALSRYIPHFVSIKQPFLFTKHLFTKHLIYKAGDTIICIKYVIKLQLFTRQSTLIQLFTRQSTLIQLFTRQSTLILPFTIKQIHYNIIIHSVQEDF